MSEVKYEFTESENEKITALVGNLRQFLLPLGIFAFLELAAAAMIYSSYRPEWGGAFYPFSALLGVVCVSFCTLIWQASEKFQLIVDTEGADIQHLMKALEKVKKSFMLATTLLLGVCALLIAAIVQVHVANF